MAAKKRFLVLIQAGRWYNWRPWQTSQTSTKEVSLNSDLQTWSESPSLAKHQDVFTESAWTTAKSYTRTPTNSRYYTRAPATQKLYTRATPTPRYYTTTTAKYVANTPRTTTAFSPSKRPTLNYQEYLELKTNLLAKTTTTPYSTSLFDSYLPDPSIDTKTYVQAPSLAKAPSLFDFQNSNWLRTSSDVRDSRKGVANVILVPHRPYTPRTTARPKYKPNLQALGRRKRTAPYFLQQLRNYHSHGIDFMPHTPPEATNNSPARKTRVSSKLRLARSADAGHFQSQAEPFTVWSEEARREAEEQEEAIQKETEKNLEEYDRNKKGSHKHQQAQIKQEQALLGEVEGNLKEDNRYKKGIHGRRKPQNSQDMARENIPRPPPVVLKAASVLG